jgi:hypothetical protein
LNASETSGDELVIHFNFDNDGVIADIPDQSLTVSTSPNNITVVVHPVRAGHVTVTTNTSDSTVE